MLNAFGSSRNLDKRILQLAKNTGVVQAAGDGVVQAAHRRSWCFCVCGVWLALGLVRIGFEMKRGFFGFITLTPKLVRMRVRVRIRVHVTGGVLQIHLTYVGRLSEQPHWRSLAVAKTRCSGGQTKVQQWPNKVHLRAEWPLQGVPSEKVASGRCSPISTNHVALFGLSCTRLGLVSTIHLALATFRQGAPCFGHRPFFFLGCSN